jgi:RHS repeat-associated protein
MVRALSTPTRSHLSCAGDHHGFTLRERMAEIAILGGTPAMHYRARTYHSDIGRLVQPDPINTTQRSYALARNVPTLFTDPSGRQEALAGKSLEEYYLRKGVYRSVPKPTTEELRPLARAKVTAHFSTIRSTILFRMVNGQGQDLWKIKEP